MAEKKINTVLYDIDQSSDTTDEQKATARANIGAQAELTAGENIEIDPDTNTISSTSAPQVQSDWTESNSGAVSYIQHKPDLVNFIPGYAIDIDEVEQGFSISVDQDFVNNRFYPLHSNPSGYLTECVQSDWDEEDSDLESYIRNKPSIPTIHTTSTNPPLVDKINNTAIYADRAECDSDGNVISQTYFKYKHSGNLTGQIDPITPTGSSGALVYEQLIEDSTLNSKIVECHKGFLQFNYVCSLHTSQTTPTHSSGDVVGSTMVDIYKTYVGEGNPYLGRISFPIPYTDMGSSGGLNHFASFGFSDIVNLRSNSSFTNIKLQFRGIPQFVSGCRWDWEFRFILFDAT